MTEFRELAYQIIQRAVRDTILLNTKYKSIGGFVDNTGDNDDPPFTVDQKELDEFFESEWFKTLCDVTETTPNEVQKVINRRIEFFWDRYFAYMHVPELLQSQKQWVAVRHDSKIPISFKSGRAASSTNPKTWTEFNKAFNSLLDNKADYYYLGYVFDEHDMLDIVGIDLDHCIDDEGNLSDMAKDIISKTNSYTEISKSGHGIHIITRGHLPFTGLNNRHGLEMYKTARFFVMTGNSYHEEQKPIIYNQDAIDYIIDTYAKTEKEEQQPIEEAETETHHSKRNIRSPVIYKPLYIVKKKSFSVAPQYPVIDEGSRHMCLLSLAGQFWNAGYDLQSLMDTLFEVNSAVCTVPLKDSEVYQIIRSISKYARKN